MSSAEQWEALRTGEISFGYGNYPPTDESLQYVEVEALLTLVASGDAVTFVPEKQVRILLLGDAIWRPVHDLAVQVS